MSGEGVAVHPDEQDSGGIGTYCSVTVPVRSHFRGSVHVRRAAAAQCVSEVDEYKFDVFISNSILCEKEEGGLVGEMVGKASQVVSGNLGNLLQTHSEEEVLR